MIQATVSALCYSLCYERAQSSQLAPPYNDVVRFVQNELHVMTDHLRPPILLLTLLFSLSSWFYNGCPFHTASVPARKKQIAAWRQSSFGFCREFIQFYESLICMPLYHRLNHFDGASP